MARQIVAVRMDGGSDHRHIAGLACVRTGGKGNFTAFTLSLAAVLEEMDEHNDFFTRDYLGEVAAVVSVKGSEGTRYIRSKKDGVLRDNLLRLPRYKRD